MASNVLVPGLPERAAPRGSRTVDEQVEPSVLFLDRAGDAQTVLAPCHEHDAGAQLATETAGGRLSDPARGTRHEGDHGGHRTTPAEAWLRRGPAGGQTDLGGGRLPRVGAMSGQVAGSAPARHRERRPDVHAGPEPEREAGREGVSRAVRVRFRAGKRRSFERAAPALARLVGASQRAMSADDRASRESVLPGIVLLARVLRAAYQHVEHDPACVQGIARPRRRYQHARGSRRVKRGFVSPREIDAVHLGEAIPGERVAPRRNEPLADDGDRALALSVEQGDGAPLGTVTDRGLELDPALTKLFARAPSVLVVAERRKERRGAGQLGELHGSDRATACCLCPRVAALDDLSLIRDVWHTNKFDPLDMSYDREAQG